MAAGWRDLFQRVTVADGPAGSTLSSAAPGWCGSRGPSRTSLSPSSATGDPTTFGGGGDGGSLGPGDYLPPSNTGKPGINALLQADLFNLL